MPTTSRREFVRRQPLEGREKWPLLVLSDASRSVRKGISFRKRAPTIAGKQIYQLSYRWTGEGDWKSYNRPLHTTPSVALPDGRRRLSAQFNLNYLFTTRGAHSIPREWCFPRERGDAGISSRQDAVKLRGLSPPDAVRREVLAQNYSTSTLHWHWLQTTEEKLLL